MASQGPSQDGGCQEDHLFKEVVGVQVKPSSRDAFQAMLTVRLRPDDPAHPRSLLVELTDEADLLFYHSLVIGEGDFHALKADQRIRVDFQSFPAQVAELLRRCCSTTQAASGADGGEGGLRMLACLDCGASGDSLLSIVEANQFRELTHIALRLRQGTDDVVKRHLAGKLKASVGECASLNERLNTSEQALRERQRQNEELNARARTLEEDRARIEQTLEATRQRELAELRAEQATATNDLQKAADTERRRLEEELRGALGAAQARAERAERAAEELQHQRHLLTTSGASLEERLEASEASLKRTSADTQELREQVKSLESLKFQHERQLGEMKVQQAALQEHVAIKEQLVASHSAQAEAVDSQRRGLEDMLAASKSQVRSLEEKLAMSAQEIAKGNQIIQSLHSGNKQARAKLKLKAAEQSQRDKTVAELEKGAELSKHQQSEREQEAVRAKEREGSLQRDVENLRTKLTETHEVLKSNQDVIEYLNRQLTERDLKAVPPLVQQDAGGCQGHAPPVAASPGPNGTRSSALAQLLKKAEGAGRGLGGWNSSGMGATAVPALLGTRAGGCFGAGVGAGLGFSPEVQVPSAASTTLPRSTGMSGHSPDGFHRTAVATSTSTGGASANGLCPRTLAFSPDALRGLGLGLPGGGTQHGQQPNLGARTSGHGLSSPVLDGPVAYCPPERVFYRAAAA